MLQARKKRTKGKRVRLKGEYVYSTPKVLGVAQDAEATPVAKRPRGRPRKQPVQEDNASDGYIEPEDQSNVSEEDLIDVVASRTRSKRVRLA
ncbi:hypothetical protein EJ04DRAFT_452609 [Polyplosphaeria fusca]|uniref:Uncharacterized protein n=1 Tax=Polyplosphaeria fusca TaxID=682080 RepID=A0A9P4UVF8_9PLEO|nr:hypothetical protein EJ04DRAFT_452609 [Polyplosphaeria fusca]